VNYSKSQIIGNHALMMADVLSVNGSVKTGLLGYLEAAKELLYLYILDPFFASLR